MENPVSLTDRLADARARTVAALSDLDDDRLLGPQLDVVNPPLWEAAHVGWFQEKWVLRHAGGRAPLRRDADLLYDSGAVPHETRWTLPLWSRRETLAYLEETLERVIARLDAPACRDDERYFATYSLFHEDMHHEAFASSRQALGWPAAPWPAAEVGAPRADGVGGSAASSDVVLAGGDFRLGAEPSEPFVFDNEKCAHEVFIAPFRMAREATTQAEFAAFVDDGGYRRLEFWDDDGARLLAQGPPHPAYWRRADRGRWERRDYDRWVALEPRRPMVHVCRLEAEAYCRWARRRLPTESEWEYAARDGGSRRFPWGAAPPDAKRARMDAASLGAADVDAHSEGDAPHGGRQMIGNVWEWTSSPFEPYPGFVRDAYAEYSEPWFETHGVLRGGSFATRSRLIRNTWRNFYRPERRDVFAGFRTCALDS
jgi:gamma-glutamyl hercynylcysteine S-oxide synthase